MLLKERKIFLDNTLADEIFELENALVTANGELKLIDFGMLTHTRTVPGPSELGTPSYLAPELRGPGQLDLFAADVFSLGVTLYIMVAGAMPWYKTYRLDQHFDAYRRLGAGQGVRIHWHACMWADTCVGMS